MKIFQIRCFTLEIVCCHVDVIHRNMNSKLSLTSQWSNTPSFKFSSTEKTCEANAVGGNSSFIFTVCVKSVPLYHFKLGYVALHLAVKEFSKPTYTNGEIGRFNRSLLMESFQLTLKFQSFVPSDVKSTCRIFILFQVAIERNSDLNLVESGASDNFKVRIFSFLSRCY